MPASFSVHKEIICYNVKLKSTQKAHTYAALQIRNSCIWRYEMLHQSAWVMLCYINWQSNYHNKTPKNACKRSENNSTWCHYQLLTVVLMTTARCGWKCQKWKSPKMWEPKHLQYNLAAALQNQHNKIHPRIQQNLKVWYVLWHPRYNLQHNFHIPKQLHECYNMMLLSSG